MKSDFQVEGANPLAPFTMKIHRGDCMALLAMNWRKGKPPVDFVGFAIEYREPDGDRFFAVKNRIGFPGARVDADTPQISTMLAPIQKFRWVHFPRFGDLAGKFAYRVTPVFMNKKKELSYGQAQEAEVELRRETHPGKLNVTFTRGFISSQAFVERFAPDGKISTLVPETAKDGLSFKATHERAEEAHHWMGFEAREAVLAALDAAIKQKAEVRVIAYDLNLPEILNRLEDLGPRLKIIIDDSAAKVGGHKAADSPESKSERRLIKSAGKANVLRQHMGGLQHHKAIAVSAPGTKIVVYGSTNFTWRGFYVQSNNAVVVNSGKAVKDFFAAFEDYWGAKPSEFRKSKSASHWHPLGVSGLSAKVAFSPHSPGNSMLAGISKDIDSAKSSVFFSLAFLGQMTKGPVGPAIGRAIHKSSVYALGIADQRVGAENLGVAVLNPDGRRKIVRAEALTGKLPKPFRAEPTGLAGNGAHRGTRMHHKFIVLDFNTSAARVYLGSYNFSEAADATNGENLVLIEDRCVATSYMIEALRLYDHYRFRSMRADAKSKREKIELRLPPATAAEKPWWDKDWTDKLRAQDRMLFA